MIIFCVEIMAGNHENLKPLVKMVLRAMVYAEMRDFCLSEMLYVSEINGFQIMINFGVLIKRYNDNEYLIDKMSHIPDFMFRNLGGLSLEELKNVFCFIACFCNKMAI